MIYYANPCSEAVRDAMTAGVLGCMATPGQGNVLAPGWDVIADNGCFAGTWEAEAWAAWLRTLPPTRFAICPDVYDPSGGACHAATLERWHQYRDLITDAGHVPAFVCQQGSTPSNVPDDAPVLFIGGSTRFKLTDALAIARAHARDRWVHMGRVNTWRRMRVAQGAGCQSVDGTFLTFGPDRNLPQLLRFLGRVNGQSTLWCAP